MGLSSLKRLVFKFFNIGHGRAKYKVIRKRITDAARIDGIHVLQLITAMFIASVGLNFDSTEMVIGAMLICPLMGSVLALSYSIATVDYKSFKNAVAGLVLQVIVCLATSTLYFVATPVHLLTNALTTNASATMWDMFVALAGGFAGALGMSRKEEPSTLIAGVAVATALMPPLCATGYGLAMQNSDAAVGAFYEFLINVVFIAAGAYIVMAALRLPVQLDLNGDGVITHEEEERVFRRTKAVRVRLLIAALILAVPCGFVSVGLVQNVAGEKSDAPEVYDEYSAEATADSLVADHPEVIDYRIAVVDRFDTKDGNLTKQLVATVVSDKEIDAEGREAIKKIIRAHVKKVEIVEFVVSSGLRREPVNET